MLSFIHTADIHLDAPLVSLSSVYEQRQYDFRLTMSRIRDLVISKQVDFWLIAGDLLEYHGGTRATALFLRDLFASVDPVPVCIAPGNHDPWMEDSFYQTIEWPANVFFFTGEWGVYEFPEKSCVIYGWGFPQAHVPESPLDRFPGRLDGYQHHLMVLHGTVLTSEPTEHQPYAPLQLSDLAKTGVNYVALGHIHKPMQFPHPTKGTPFAAYPGSPEGLTVKEQGPRAVLFGQVDEAGQVRLTPIPVQSRQILRVEWQASGVETVDALLARLQEDLREIDSDSLLYLTLTGERASHLIPPLELIRGQLQRFFYLHLEDETWPDIDEDKLLTDYGILGRWIKKLRDIEETATDVRERETARLARQEATKRIGGMLR
ncbi:DNA repair exonuclease [Brevibacillus dissolubilis]|uniref:DNA repair exonuclease n=1 Tax=Brevibacillus dissolubilis TaxID=1844116 RepID=UPI0011174219|nr:DNA repair exonuclease [Brevibacillus dissolubilis]